MQLIVFRNELLLNRALFFLYVVNNMRCFALTQCIQDIAIVILLVLFGQRLFGCPFLFITHPHTVQKKRIGFSSCSRLIIILSKIFKSVQFKYELDI